jgi:hypothetical protein
MTEESTALKASHPVSAAITATVTTISFALGTNESGGTGASVFRPSGRRAKTAVSQQHYRWVIRERR